MNAPDPFLLPPSAAAPGRAAAALTRALTARGITGIITAAAQKFAVISVTASLTIWTDGTWFNADPARYPAPGRGGWTAQTIWAILRNPKYTGHMVYGRTRTRSGRRVRVPASEWLWSPGPVHPAIIDRVTWDAAQQVAGEHSTSRDGTKANAHPATARFYPYRGRVRCKTCQRRMAGRASGC